MIDRVVRLAGWYGVPLQVQKMPEPEQGVQKMEESSIRPVDKVQRMAPPRDTSVPRDVWLQYAELRQEIKRLRNPYQRRDLFQM
ncbi:hypothetical protein CBW65_02515 [Tumebacillus avium]|uniref:Uncharacterized protein n=1 Tax=Tumebacillus avium TaxID=1903704 RepID=A0A1Y0IHS3_9BACL|nr:hypothetical protein [Tumebacillus avium]ARU60061.1 hypothetical protein CBW65_02515 [Tumebacillus avium]